MSKFEFGHMPTGKVKLFNVQKGYGFIALDDSGGNDVFFHISAFQQAGLTMLSEGLEVEFDVTKNRGSKSTARNMRLIES
jgi:CspA family cold shock protein